MLKKILFAIMISTPVFADNFEEEASKSLNKKFGHILSTSSRETHVSEYLSKYDECYREALALTNTKSWDVYFKHAFGNKFLEAEALYQKSKVFLAQDNYGRALTTLERLIFDYQNFNGRNEEITVLYIFSLIKMDEISSDRTYITLARSTLARFLNTTPYHGPERWKEIAIWIDRELKGAGSGPLLEVSKQMEAISRLLKDGKTGFNPTQKRQRDIEKELKRLIQLLEDSSKGGGGECKKCNGKGCRECEKPSEEKDSGNPKPENAMNKSKLPKSGGKTNLKEKAAAPAEEWGGLNKKERKKVLQNIKERFPLQYKEIIEQYFKSLNR